MKWQKGFIFLEEVIFFFKYTTGSLYTLGLSPDPCRRKVPVMNQKLLEMEN